MKIIEIVLKSSIEAIKAINGVKLIKKVGTGLRQGPVQRERSEHAGRVAACCWMAAEVSQATERNQILQDAWDAFGEDAFKAAFSRPAWKRKESWDSSVKWCLPFDVALRLNLPRWSEPLARMCPGPDLSLSRIHPKVAAWPLRARLGIPGAGGALCALCDANAAQMEIRVSLMNIYMQCREAPRRGPELMRALSLLEISDPIRQTLLAWVESGEIEAATRRVGHLTHRRANAL